MQNLLKPRGDAPGSMNTQMNTEMRLMNYGNQIKNKRKQQKADKDSKECEQFDFQPRINQRSKSLANSRKSYNQIVGPQFIDKGADHSRHKKVNQSFI